MQCFVAYHHHKNFSNSLGASRGSVSLGAWFGFAFLAAVLCELCGKEELNREERQGFAKDAKQVRGLALRSWRQSGASFAVRRISPRRTPRIRKGRTAMLRGFGFPFFVPVLCELCGKEELNREERQGFAKDAKQVLIPRGKLSHCRKRSLHCARSRRGV